MATDITRDEQITDAIEQQFAANDKMKDVPIEVSSLAGEVTLRGTVKDEALKTAAEQLAQSAPGVSVVINELVVDPDARADDGRVVPVIPFVPGSGTTGGFGGFGGPGGMTQR